MSCTCNHRAMTPAEAADYLGGLDVRTLANWRSAGRGPHYVKDGRHVAYRREALDEWMDGKTVKTKKRRVTS